MEIQSKLLALVTVHVEFCARGNVPNIYCIKTRTINIQNLAASKVIVVHILIVK